MTWNQFMRRFKEMMADTSTTPLGVTDLEAWHRKQKEITERCLREEQEKRERRKNRLNQDAYVKASLPKNVDVPSVHLLGYSWRKAYAGNPGASANGDGKMFAPGYHRLL